MLGWIHADDGELAWSTRMMKRWLLLTGIICVSVPVRADVKLPAIFGNEMVIQRETKAPVWGWADPGEKVTVTGSWGQRRKRLPMTTVGGP